MLISQKPTGRRWGDKKPPRFIRKDEEGRHVVEFDGWCGPEAIGEQGEYHRYRVAMTAAKAKEILGK